MKNGLMAWVMVAAVGLVIVGLIALSANYLREMQDAQKEEIYGLEFE